MRKLQHLSALLIGLPVLCLALPQGEQVRGGTVSFDRQDNELIVNQSSGRAIVQYGSFDVGAGETVRFNQPGASSAILNRVGGGASTIAGSLIANGRVFLINPSGILFAPGAQVNVHGLVASAMAMSDADFMSGLFRFSGPGGSVVNQGSINAAFAYLVGGSVRNDGAINAGSVALAAGRDSIEIGQAAGGAISLIIDGDGPDDSVESDRTDGSDSSDSSADSASTGEIINNGSVDAAGAEGGVIRFGGEAIAQSGSVRADGSEGAGGRIDIRAREVLILSEQSVTSANAGRAGKGGEVIIYSDGRTGVDGFAEVSARGGLESGDGGFVELSGREYLEWHAPVDVGAPKGAPGELLLDPTDILVDTGATASTGGQFNPTPPPREWQPTAGFSTISGADLEAQLQNGNVTISTQSPFTAALGGTIRVADNSGGSAALRYQSNGSVLVFDAERDLEIEVPIRPLNDAQHLAIDARAFRDITIEALIDTNGETLELTAARNVSVLSTKRVLDTRRPGAGSGGDVLIRADFNDSGTGDVELEGGVRTGGGEFRSSGVNFNFNLGSIQTDGGDVVSKFSRNAVIAGNILAGAGDGVSGGAINLQAERNINLVPAGQTLRTNGPQGIAIGADYPDRNGTGDIDSVALAGQPAAPYRVIADGSIFLFGQNVNLQGGRFAAGQNAAISVVGRNLLLNDLRAGTIAAQALEDIAVSGTIIAQDSFALEAGGQLIGLDPVIRAERIGFRSREGLSGNVDLEFGSVLFIRTATQRINVFKPGSNAPRSGEVSTPDLAAEVPVESRGIPTAKVSFFLLAPPEPPAPPPPAPPPVLEALPVIPELGIQAVVEEFFREVIQVSKAATEELPDSKVSPSVLAQFYFLYEYMQSSEFASQLDLNFVSYLLFGTARITADTDFPSGAKKAIYFGGEKPVQVEVKSFQL